LFEVNDGALSLTASDNETTMATSLEVIESDGNCRFAINAKTILDALKEIPEQPLTFVFNPDTLEILVQYMNGRYSVVAQNADEYPIPVTLGDSAVHVEMEASTMLNGINRALFATADDELRPVMNGIYFDITTDDLTMVASDGHKLVRNKNFATKGNEKAAFILPKKPATLLKNLLGKEQGAVSIDFDDRNATLERTKTEMRYSIESQMILAYKWRFSSMLSVLKSVCKTGNEFQRAALASFEERLKKGELTRVEGDTAYLKKRISNARFTM
jgi:DNA polymerase-3 subunit beta